jgi:hypothetical protein
MPVNEKNAGDLNVEEPAKYMVNGVWYEVDEVYSDKNDRKRRDIFVSEPDTRKVDLPEEVKVKYHGKEYTGELSWRTGRRGQSIPVYQYYVQSPYYESG